MTIPHFHSFFEIRSGWCSCWTPFSNSNRYWNASAKTGVELPINACICCSGLVTAELTELKNITCRLLDYHTVKDQWCSARKRIGSCTM